MKYYNLQLHSIYIILIYIYGILMDLSSLIKQMIRESNFYQYL